MSEQMTLRKAAEMALEALERLDRWLALRYGNELTPPEREVVKALRQALAQPEQEPFILDRGCWERGCVAYDERDGDGVNILADRVDETVKNRHEPYGYVWTSLRDGMEVRFSRMPPNKFYNPQDIKPVYTAPPKAAEWVGLTDEELPQGETYEFDRGVRWAEAKLKEKNGW